MLLRPASALFPANSLWGALAGIQAASAYAALEILLNGPLTLREGESIGPDYAGAVFVYLVLYAVLGALIGGVVGFLLGRLGRMRHHLLPTMAALLMLAFVGNAWCWGSPPGSSPYLALLVPYAFWLACGLLFPEKDNARTVAGSPWLAAVVTLAPHAVFADLMDDSLALTTNLVAATIVAAAVAVSLLARRRTSLVALAASKGHSAFTAAALLAGFGMMRIAAAPPTEAAGQSEASARPNIVLISLDTTRADHLSVYGYARRTTPRLEAFASGATLYRHAYANGDMTLASHASMFTGLFPMQHGAHYDGDFRRAIASEIPTLAELLRKAGYRTAASVANTALLDPSYGFARGFDRYAMPRHRGVVVPSFSFYLRMGVYKLTLPWLWTEALRRFVKADEIATTGERMAAQPDGKPFFLFVNFMESHRPWISSNEFRARYPAYDQTFDEMKMLSFSHAVATGKYTIPAHDVAKMHAAYDGSIAYLDDVAGGLLERLKRQPWYGNSLIVVTADHGEFFGEHGLLDHGNSVGHELTSIPMIVKFPGQTARREVQSPVSQVDVFSTIAAAAGVAQPAGVRGVDLALGDPGDERTIVMESYPFINFTSVNPKMNRLERGLVKGRWKMIQSNRGRRDLYDMVSDPRESKNLWSSETEVAREMDRLLREWVASSGRQRPVTRIVPQQRNLLRRLKALGYAQ